MDEYWFRLAGYLSRPRSLLAMVLLVFVGTRLWVLLGPNAMYPDTATYYAKYARLGVDCELVVYHDFQVEYPPVAWWLMMAPRLIDSTDYEDPDVTAEAANRFFDWYFNWFHALLCLADTACLLLMYAMGRRMLPEAAWALPAAYTLLTIAQPHLIYDRLDVVLLLLFLLCIVCWLRSLADSPAADRWAAASYLFLGLGISFKIMPVIFVPYLLLADLRAMASAWQFAMQPRCSPPPRWGPFCTTAIGRPRRAFGLSVPFRAGHSFRVGLGQHHVRGFRVRCAIPRDPVARRHSPGKRLES